MFVQKLDLLSNMLCKDYPSFHLSYCCSRLLAYLSVLALDFFYKQNLGQLPCCLSSVNLSKAPMVSSQSRPRTEPFGILLETLLLCKIGPLPSLSVCGHPVNFLTCLFIWPCRVLVAACRIFVAACGIFLVAACGLLWHVRS